MKKGAHGHYFIPFNRYNPPIIDSNQTLYVVRSKVWFYLPDRHEAHPQERILVQGLAFAGPDLCYDGVTS